MAFALGFLSLLIVARLRSAGLPVRRVAWLVAELWAVFVLWLGVLWAAASRLVPEGGLGSGRDLREFAARFSAMHAGSKALVLASLGLGMAVFVHFNWALRAAMAEHRLDDAD
jgi:hypothetical protein